MFFRQIFDCTSCTYTYIISTGLGREALIIDPVLEHAAQYGQLLEECELKLALTIDTHTHADHVTASGTLRKHQSCAYAMGEHTKVECIDISLQDGNSFKLDGIEITPVHTPGHTDDSYCFVIDNKVFTGDTLLIRGTGRTDFQNGDPAAQYDSLFNKLLKLPDETQVYPAHDYNGMTVSTIAEERQYNPRLQVKSKQEYIDLMNNLNLARPKLVEIAVPANLKGGLAH